MNIFKHMNKTEDLNSSSIMSEDSGEEYQVIGIVKATKAIDSSERQKVFSV